MCNAVCIGKLEKALNGAIAVATKRNIPPLKGCTLLLVSVGNEMARSPMTGSSRPASRKLTQALDVALLLSSMCKLACENVKFVLFDSVTMHRNEFASKDGDRSENLLEQVKNLALKISGPACQTLEFLVQDQLMDSLRLKLRFDQIVLVHGGHLRTKIHLKNWIEQYRVLVNPGAMYVDLDVCGKSVNNQDFGEFFANFNVTNGI